MSLIDFRVPIFVPKEKVKQLPKAIGDCDPNNAPDPTDPAIAEYINICYHDQYCQFLNQNFTQEEKCLEQSLLQLWPEGQDFTNIKREDILKALNDQTLVSRLASLDRYLSAIRDENGQITGATSVTMTWYGETDVSAITEEDLAAAEDGIAADAITLDFELKLKDFLLDYGQSLEADGYSLYVAVARGYADVARDEITADSFLLPVGFMAVMAYATFMLGHLTCVENRVRGLKNELL